MKKAFSDAREAAVPLGLAGPALFSAAGQQKRTASGNVYNPPPRQPVSLSEKQQQQQQQQPPQQQQLRPSMEVLMRKIRTSASTVFSRANLIKDAAQKSPIDVAMVAAMADVALQEL